MAETVRSPSTSRVLIILLLLLSTAPKPSHSLSYLQYKTLVSLSHSLMTRVANLRASRGDIRARTGSDSSPNTSSAVSV
ncbi:hypothetical protein SLA2020_403530 [Shorea laevis]